MSNTATISHKWSIKGKQPQVEQKQRKRERKTLFGCVDPKTGIVITDVADRGNTITFFTFLVKVTKLYPQQKVTMVVDNVRYHHAKRLKPILEKYKNRIELAYLPPYSPDLNPIETFWANFKRMVRSNLEKLKTLADAIDFSFLRVLNNE